MARLTRPKDQFQCRMANCEEVEEWIINMGGSFYDINMCKNCPIQAIANKLAEYEDKYETLET